MAITAAITNSYKADLFAAVHAPGDVYKMSLYPNAATIDKNTTAYTSTGEVTGTGYTAGGITLTGYTPGAGSDAAWIDWTDPVWANSTITARGALIYNSSKSNKSVAVLNFGADIISTNGPFTVQLPTPDATNAVVRIA